MKELINWQSGMPLLSVIYTFIVLQHFKSYIETLLWSCERKNERSKKKRRKTREKEIFRYSRNLRCFILFVLFFYSPSYKSYFFFASFICTTFLTYLFFFPPEFKNYWNFSNRVINISEGILRRDKKRYSFFFPFSRRPLPKMLKLMEIMPRSFGSYLSRTMRRNILLKLITRWCFDGFYENFHPSLFFSPLYSALTGIKKMNLHLSYRGFVMYSFV